MYSLFTEITYFRTEMVCLTIFLQRIARMDCLQAASHRELTRDAAAKCLSELLCIVHTRTLQFSSDKSSVVVLWKNSWCDMGLRRTNCSRLRHDYSLSRRQYPSSQDTESV